MIGEVLLRETEPGLVSTEWNARFIPDKIKERKKIVKLHL